MVVDTPTHNLCVQFIPLTITLNHETIAPRKFHGKERSKTLLPLCYLPTNFIRFASVAMK